MLAGRRRFDTAPRLTVRGLAWCNFGMIRVASVLAFQPAARVALRLSLELALPLVGGRRGLLVGV
ncbi:MAG: hypothetical protein EBV65_05570 [Gammaproteobacteria bacterium]|nr:hypothetical protein [Gammaproteobacteria bacterium]